ncbi:MAG: hypothetical protein PWQ28_105 [Candidatus Woesearchaeota archaeon]|nr:hypothetical protein [Candidatus Woesearchaeota archaeon]
MKSYYRLGVLFVLLVLLTGCGTQPTGEERSKSGFIGGTSGLVMNWIIPEEGYVLYDQGNNEIFVSLRVENLGEYDIPPNSAVVSLSGFSYRDFGIMESDLRKVIDTGLSGKDEIDNQVVSGDIADVSFGPLKYVPSINTRLNMPIYADICYPYETNAESVICIAENPTDTRVCNPNGARPVYSSGAPVQISSVTQKALGDNRYSLSIEIKHVGNGGIYKLGEDCDSSSFSSKGVVRVTVGDPVNWGWDSVNIECNGVPAGQSFATRIISGGLVSVRCNIEVADSAAGDYVKVLPITVEYDYSDTTSTQLEVRSSSGFD